MNNNGNERYIVKVYDNKQDSCLICKTIPETYPIEDFIFKPRNKDFSLINIAKVIYDEEDTPIEFFINIYDSSKWQVKEYISSLNENNLATEYFSTESNFKIHSKVYFSYTINIACESQEQILEIYHIVSRVLTNRENTGIKALTKMLTRQ